MFRHNLLIAYRSFLRNKSSFIINLIGLSTGLAGVLMIFLWMEDELKIDTFHEKDSQLYQVMNNYHGTDGIQTWEISPWPLAAALMEEFPEVEVAAFANYDYFPDSKVIHENKSIVSASVFASDRFFDVLSFDLLHGNREEILATKDNIVLSEDLAKKLFGSTANLIGKSVDFEGLEGPLKISGIFSAPPANSTLQFDAVLSADLMVEIDPPSKEWNSTSGRTYVVLKQGADIDLFNKKIEHYRGKKDPNMKANTMFAQRYSQKYLNGRYENGKPVGGRIEYIQYFSILAIFLLLIASINFMNLSTAQASRKMKEIGVKKTIGASRKALIFQFLTESILMVVLSLMAAWVWVTLLLPQFNEITGKSLSLGLELNHILLILGVGVLTGCIAGSYPAFYLSAFKPVSVLKGKIASATGEKWVRKGLVVFQFIISGVFIIGVLVVDQQLQYTQTKDMGYSRDNVISFLRPDNAFNIEVLLAKLRSIPGVESASNMSRSILTGKDDQKGFSWSGDESEKETLFLSPQINFEMIETLGLEMIAGRSFSKEYKDDRSKIIINESAQRVMQEKDIVGKSIDKGKLKVQVIGVVKDFHYGSLHQQVKPLIFRLRQFGRNFVVKIKKGTEKKTIEQIEGVYTTLYPDAPFSFTFLDEDNMRLYEAETRVSLLSKYFAGLAIIISCLGLFGLSIFTTEQRKKEIGIRKVLGSSVFGIVHMLTRDFTKTIVIGIIISLPISYLIAREWLSNFAYTFELNLWLFLLPGVFILVLAWSTVGAQTLRAAQQRPVHSLRDE